MVDNVTAELPNCKDFLEKLGPLDSLLGSVSYNEIDTTYGKTQQLRTSARVFKKMKFDLSNTATVEKEKKEEPKPEEPKQENKRTPNPFWTSEERCLFFEALNEYGKDFETMHSYISQRLKKKGVPEDLIKNRYQLRHFYYKTFHMLLSHLKYSESIPKNVQELYALINYGEIRRKIGSVSKKNLLKLNELVHNGSISLRTKGKAIKIKTPMCRALRRLNQLDEKYDDLKLPTRVAVELKPKDMVSFLKVQSMAQNPRIKVILSLQKRLSSLINCVTMRWKTAEAVVYDKASVSTNPVTKDCVPDPKVIEENSLLLTPFLRLSPLDSAHLELPSIDISEYFTGQSICLNAFENRRNAKLQAEEVKKEDPESLGGKGEKSSPKQTADANDNSEAIQPAALQIEDHLKNSNAAAISLAKDFQKCDNKVMVKTISQEEKLEKIAELKRGWTLENCESITVGELYLMFGAESKLVLQYNWDPIRVKTQLKEEVDDKVDNLVEENILTGSLKKLLSVAKLQMENVPSPPVTKCSCGHVCGAKATSQFKKPAASRVLKKSQAAQDSNVGAKIEDTDANSRFIIEPKCNDESYDESTSPVVHLLHQRDTIQKLNPKIRARGRYRQFVVERKLVPNKSESKHQIVSMNIVPDESKPKETLTKTEPTDLLAAAEIPMSIDQPISDSVDGKNFSGLLGESPCNSVMSTGLTKILKENENQWINNEVADYSLSSLLGHLDCQTKTNQSMASINDTQLSQDVDAQLRTLLIESSIDYTAQFADLADEVNDIIKK